MTSNASLDNEISRILTSDTSQRLTNQLKTINSRDSKIEEEILMKSTQIAKLQNYLRNELANIQGIVEENNRLKKEIQAHQKEDEVKAKKCNQLEKEINDLKQTNLASNYVIRRLQEKNVQLSDQIDIIKNQIKISTASTEIQTVTPFINTSIPNKQVGVNTQIDKIQQSSNNQKIKELMVHITQLQQTIMHLRFQKSELKLKLHCFQPGESKSIINTQNNQQQIIQKKITTFEVISMVCDKLLNQVIFKGQILNGTKEGKGICQYEEGIQYEGEFHNNTRHGLGSLFVNDQVLYHGFWKEGLMEGKGILHMLQGQIQSYEGQFHEGKIEGYGYMKLKSGKKILGFWQDGRMVGKCMQSVGTRSRFTEPELIQCY